MSNSILVAFDTTIFIQAMAKALAVGSLYALVALGFVLVFKATQTVNFAQGAIAAAGAWFVSLLIVDWTIPGRWLGDSIYLTWFIALILGCAMAAVLGLVIERTIIRRMIGEPLFSVAVITLGLDIVIRTIVGDAVTVDSRLIEVPWGGYSGFNIGPAFVPWAYIASMITAAICFTGVFLFFKTRMGIAMRAVAFDQEAALAQGISVGKVFAIAWGASTALAGLAGVLGAMTPIGQGTVTLALTGLAFRALPAVILGGLDSVIGALFGGLAIGGAEVLAGEYLSGFNDFLGTGYALVVPYIVMLVVLLVRPYGLFGTPEIRRV